MRMRIVSLQALLVVVLAAAGGFAVYEGNFVQNMVRTELTAQSISFPAADQIKAGGALDPKEFPQEIRDQAGNQVTDGNQARIYASDFIGKHLEGVAGGLTYSQVSAKASAANAALAAMSKDDPNYASAAATAATLSGQKATLFQGDTLRATLLNSYAWWTMGVDAMYAGYALIVAALVVLGALVFELFFAKREDEVVGASKRMAA
jgi:hypothetical protein